ncbi:4-oxalocrotonate tautomerase family (PptA) (PDB:1BJP) [Commensalibacter communis]|uniref:4-oxalocrotonate tautomerase family (PptA) n=1 Tax=Commensalibacter communis TaxID=2972786 RepID=A0A9W4TQD9_9PROT|nr:tautomerase family protein [Commensalibacter communis]CAI3954839.1 4-oxalocrotonate tautomerase family (PptA) (PDB:1BJP) [Commensalibacter communis]CAI3956103.1 4-oxalocrotonate tautomerase family (PptA) (PDB:1BJP) [Commensalibacter communis]CAI3956814.1 4-oxalocrotonate tautomerase family (PptA) (PDB:1BJP) [Commensalibacter communis]CAI3957001.1 4-oxalocrotonate tautomerase family (PptA) (PDB:1BJP) [Commensalibacter communis]CAI3957824.1 4-oxalocrotonate tautomerase family (PptA) (PDB:1BJP
MPLIRIDVVEGRNQQELNMLKETIHRAMVIAFEVPERDRYQILTQHKPGFLVAEDTGLDIPRTDKFVLIQMISRPRSAEQKKKFYSLVCQLLKENCGIEASDVMTSIVVNSDEDWSFGLGRAQFLEGDL